MTLIVQFLILLERPVRHRQLRHNMNGWIIGTMKNVLIIAAIVAAGTGAGLFVVPSLVGQLLFGEQLAGVAIPAARVAGIALIAMGIACWPSAFGTKLPIRDVRSSVASGGNRTSLKRPDSVASDPERTATCKFAVTFPTGDLSTT